MHNSDQPLLEQRRQDERLHEVSLRKQGRIETETDSFCGSSPCWREMPGINQEKIDGLVGGLPF